MKIAGSWVKEDERYMREALAEAEKALGKGEVPIGAVVVSKGEIISRGHNLRESTQSSTAHAEMIAIEEACKATGSWRLEDCILYVTLEPCPMCSGAIMQSRIKRVVFGAIDEKGGCCGTIMNLLDEPRFNHQASITSGILAEESTTLLKNFFRKLRNNKKSNEGKSKN